MKRMTLGEKDAVLAWAVDKDGGDRLEGFANRDKVRRLRDLVIDADHETALVYDWALNVMDYRTWLEWTGHQEAGKDTGD